MGRRRRQVARLALEMQEAFTAWGIHSSIALALDVSRSTVHRDVKTILARQRAGRSCPACGKVGGGGVIHA
jgi:hypothetical protein